MHLFSAKLPQSPQAAADRMEPAMQTVDRNLNYVQLCLKKSFFSECFEAKGQPQLAVPLVRGHGSEAGGGPQADVRFSRNASVEREDITAGGKYIW